MYVCPFVSHSFHVSVVNSNLDIKMPYHGSSSVKNSSTNNISIEGSCSIKRMKRQFSAWLSLLGRMHSLLFPVQFSDQQKSHLAYLLPDWRDFHKCALQGVGFCSEKNSFIPLLAEGTNIIRVGFCKNQSTASFSALLFKYDKNRNSRRWVKMKERKQKKEGWGKRVKL